MMWAFLIFLPCPSELLAHLRPSKERVEGMRVVTQSRSTLLYSQLKTSLGAKNLTLTALQGVGDLLNLHDVVIVVHDAGLLVVWTHRERRET